MVDVFIRSRQPQYFICARESRVDSSKRLRVDNKVFVQVEAYDKDGAIQRLCDEYPYVSRTDWEILEVIEKFDHEGKEHDIGFFGTKLPLKLHH